MQRWRSILTENLENLMPFNTLRDTSLLYSGTVLQYYYHVSDDGYLLHQLTLTLHYF